MDILFFEVIYNTIVSRVILLIINHYSWSLYAPGEIRLDDI